MSKRSRAGAIAIVLMVAIAGMITAADALTGGASDPDDTTGTDISNAYHSDDGAAVTLGFQAVEDFAATEVNAKWDLDLDGAAGFEDCITLKRVSGVLRAQAFNDCGPEIFSSADATRPANNKVEFKVLLSDLQGIGLSPTATSFKYRLANTNSAGNTDQVPDVVTDSITNTLGADPSTPSPTPVPTPTPEPTPTPVVPLQEATDTQGIGATLQGVLSINAVEPGVAFGSVAAGGTKTVNIGDVDYTNTLGSGNNWTVTVKSTSLVGGANVIPFSNLKYAPGATITRVPSGAGSLPTAQPTETAFSGTDTTPGTAYSGPVTMATGASSIQGGFRQSGSTLKLDVPPSAVGGNYVGTLQYTITG